MPNGTVVSEGARLLEMINAGWVSQALSATAELGLADCLAKAGQSAESLATELNCNPDAMRRLLRALASLEVVREDDDGTFALLALGQLLRSDVPDSLNAQAQWFGRYTWPFWGELSESVRSGVGGRERKKGQVGYGHLQEDAAAARVFNRAMIELTRLVGKGVVAQCDFTGVQRMVDVGGGHGELLAAILTAYPQMHGHLVDLGHAIEGARQHMANAGLCGRVTVEEGDFFIALPAAADVYLLKAVLHNWDDAHCEAILATVRAAVRPDSRMVLVERVLPDRVTNCGASQSVVRSDLNMLIGLGGRERTQQEFKRLLVGAGFRVNRFIEVSTGFFAIDCSLEFPAKQFATL
jgi:hypothetical protein